MPSCRRRPSSNRRGLLYVLAILHASSLLCSAAAATGKCLRFADERKINKLFSDGGPGTKIYLCAGEKYLIHNPIVFTAKDQELATQGYPERDEDKATIKVMGGLRGVAVQGDCRRCARVSLSHLIIDGNRANLGRIPNPDYMASDEIQGLDLKPKHALTHSDLSAGTALVLLGNNEGQSIRSCRLKDPRGWTAIQIREGDNLSCMGAVIEDNVIGPAGEEWVEEVDGEAPELSPLGRPLADGLSIACRDSFVRRNTIIDTTEASINIYCSPGSLIADNHIIARTRTQMGGILMIDASPFNGDYSNTRVHNNTIEAEENALIRVGIGLGSAIWSDDTETVLFGGTVTSNRIRGLGMGYGIAAAGLEDFTLLDNESLARHGGRRGERCLVPVEDDDPEYDRYSEKELHDGILKNPIPQAFLKTPATIQGGEWQEDFVEGEFSYLVCIDKDPDDRTDEHNDLEEQHEEERREDQPNQPPQPRPVPVVPVVPAEEPSETQSAVNSVLNNIFSHSQARMLEVIADLGAQVEGIKLRSSLQRQLAGIDHGAHFSMDKDGSELLASLTKMTERVALLETDRHSMRGTMDGLREELRVLSKGLDKFETHESAVLSEVLDYMTFQSGSSHRDESVLASPHNDRYGTVETHPPYKRVPWWKPFLYILGFQLLVVGAGLAWRNRRRTKGIKRI